MLGLGSSVVSKPVIGKSVVRDGLVLKHDYSRGYVELCSTGAADFDGADDYINIGNAFNLGAVDFSMTCWIWVSTKESQDFISKYENDSNRWYLRTQGNGYVQFAAKDGSSTPCDHVTSTAVPEKEWVHVAITNDRSDGSVGEKIYINGVMTNAGGAATTTDVTNTGDINIAKHGTSYGESYMCNVGIWSGAALTQAQVKSIMLKDYASLSASEKTGLVSWWNLDSTLTSTIVLDNHYGGNSELGSELWDSPWSTNGSTDDWVVYDVNTVSTVNGALQITHGGGSGSDNTAGANLSLRDTTVLSGNLTVGSVYKIVYDIKVNTGSVTVMINQGSSNEESPVASSSNYVTQTVYFVPDGVSHPYFKLGHNLAAGQVVTLDNFSLKLVNGNTGTLS